MATTNSTTASTTSYSYLQYKNKIGGLVSGMDIDSIMEKLMKAESAQKEKLEQQKQKYEWQRDAYREVNVKLSTFEQSALTDYGLQSSWNAKTVAVSNSAATATATATAAGNLNITEAKMATAGQKIMDMPTTKLSDLGFSSEKGKVNYTVDGETKSFEFSKNDTLTSLMNKMNATGDFSASIIADENGVQSLQVKANKAVTFVDDTGNGVYSKAFANKLGFSSSQMNANGEVAADATSTKQLSIKTINSNSTLASLGLTDGTFKIKAVNEQGTYTEKTITYKATDKVSEIMSRINSSGVGVTAIVSNDKLSITANVEGAGVDGSINISEDENGLFQKLGVLSGKTGNVTKDSDGESGYIVANGVKLEGSSNKYNVSGYQITINNNISASDSATKISSTTNTDTIVDKVKAFVATYNELISTMSKKTAEKKNISYAPLTDAQKAEMTTDEITKWEEKAKAGLLKNDATLNKVVSDFRNTLSTYGSGSTDTLYKLGITTSATWTDGGKLEVNEDKLRTALADDPEIVSRIFTGDSASGEEGIIAKMRTTAKNAVATIKDKAGSENSASATSYSLGKSISSVESKISDWADRLKDIEERYWKQFSAMETAIQKANSQSSIFSAS